MINDIWTSVKAYLYDRTSSPLLGALVVGWIAWNFKILMLFFSKTTYAVKVWEMDYFYSQTFWLFNSLDVEHWVFSNNIFCVVVMPVITAIFYIYIFPWFSHKVFNYSYQKQINMNNKKKQMQGSELMSVEEKAEVMAMFEKAKLENRELVIKHRQEIELLERQLNTLTEDSIKRSSDSGVVGEKVEPETAKHEASELSNNKFNVVSEKSSTSSRFLFYEIADKEMKELYQSILNYLCLGRKSIYDFNESDRDRVTRAIPNLNVEGLIDVIDDQNDSYFMITNDGRKLLKAIGRGEIYNT
ncbi:hypothetical protein AB6D33_20625 [Vibrio splendidus]